MSKTLWLPQLAPVPTPLEVAGYLLQRHWKLKKSGELWAEYEADEGIVVEVPQEVNADDYPRVVAMLLEDLAHLEKRTPAAVLRDMKAEAVDIVRLSIDSALTKDGRIPVEAGRRGYEASRNLLLAAACSAIDPRPVFAKRKPDAAMKLLEQARFGHAELGSFVLTMEFNIPPRLQRSLLPDETDAEAVLERMTSTLLALALREVSTASREASASGTLSPFTERTQLGVSSNLCDAVAEVIEATSAETLTASFSFAARRPLVTEVPRRTVFSSDTAPILREAAFRMRDEATLADTDIMGPVVKLDSSNPTDGGVAVIKSAVDGRFRSIKVFLGAEMYGAAIEAHRERQLIKCVGELKREGGSLMLRNPRDFSVEPDDI